MLQLDEEFNLLSVFRRVPPEQLKIPKNIVQRYIDQRRAEETQTDSKSKAFRFQWLQGRTVPEVFIHPFFLFA